MSNKASFTDIQGLVRRRVETIIISSNSLTGALYISDLSASRFINIIIEKSFDSYDTPIELAIVKHSGGGTDIEARRLIEDRLVDQKQYTIYIIYFAYYIPTDQ